MFLQLLRDETKQAHQSLESLLIPHLKNITQKEDYISLLKIFYGFYQPLEEMIDEFIHDDLLNERRKAQWLLADLNVLGYNDTSIKLCQDMPAISDKAMAIGALYVLEGSTLGGKIISAMLQKNMGVGTEEGIGFFTGYGDNTNVKWAEFIAFLNQNIQSSIEQNDTLTTANETFVKFRSWIASCISSLSAIAAIPA